MWETEMVTLLRNMIGDTDVSEQTYSDERLQETILTAAQMVLSEIVFTIEYEVDVDEVILNPDPTDRTARDNDFMNLVLLKAGCFIATNEARIAAAQAITIRDQGSMISLGGSGGVLAGRLALLKEYCVGYKDAKNSFKAGNGTIGVVITGPAPGQVDPYLNRYR